ncbi:hypothetical protein H4R33_003213, partial [Dimargaris cristalligena]
MVVLTVAAFGVVAHADQPTTTASEDSHVPTLVRRMFNPNDPGVVEHLMNGGLPNMGGGITQQQAPYYFQGNAVPPHMIPSAMQQANYMAQMNYGLRPGQATTNPLGAIPHQANGIQTNMSANTIQQTNGIQSNIGANAVQQANGIQTNMGANTMQQAQHNARMNDGLHRGKII